MDKETIVHKSVLLNESVAYLKVEKGLRYIDCTLGGGGHTAEILRAGGIVLGLDVDEYAVRHCEKRFEKEIREKKLTIAKRNFAEIGHAAKEIGWEDRQVSGILYDLGVSTFQLKNEERGFSFTDKGHLDMRMDETLSVTANDLIYALSEGELSDLIRDYGEDPQHKKFAKAIKDLAKKARGTIRAEDLANVIKNNSVYKSGRINPATRVFQALRIAVNSELESLKESLRQAPALLKPEGRLVIISFHSLEDKIVKDLRRAP